MAYQTGTSTGMQDILDKLRIFASANGWTVDIFDTTTSNSRWLHLTRTAGGCSLGMQFTYPPALSGGLQPVLRLIGDEGYSAVAWNAQANASGIVNTNFPLGAFSNYWFFGTVDYMHVVVSPSAGIYMHFSFGVLNKAGAYNGGSYVTGGFWDPAGNFPYVSEYQYNRGAFDCHSYTTGMEINFKDQGTHWYTAQDYSGAGAPQTGPNGEQICFGGCRYGAYHEHFLDNPNTSTGLAILLPMPFYAKVAAGRYLPLGNPKDVRGINMVNYSPQDEIVIGSDTWKVFPLAQKGPVNSGTIAPISSGVYGLAYKKIP